MSGTPNIRLAAGFSCVIAWFALFTCFSFAASSSLQDTAVPMAVACVVAGVVACILRLAAPRVWAALRKVLASRRRVIDVASAAVAFLAQAVFIATAAPASRAACFLVAFGAMTVLAVNHGSDFSRMDERTASGCCGLTAVAASVTYAVAVLVAGGIGSVSNFDLRMRVALAVLSLLPLASALLLAGPKQPAAADVSREDQPARLEDVMAPAAVLVAFAVYFLMGFTAGTYRLDPLMAFDDAARFLFAVGVLFLAAYAAFGTNAFKRDARLLFLGVVVVILVVGLAATVSLAVIGQFHESLALLVAAGTLLLALGVVRGSTGFAVLTLLGGSLLLYLLGVVARQSLGVDGTTLGGCVIIVLAAMLVGFAILTVRKLASSAGRASEPSAAPASVEPLTATEEAQAEEPASETLAESYREYLSTFGLSGREMEVALLFVQGSTIDETAQLLDVSVNTVRYHTKALYAKCGVSGKVELRKVVMAGAREQSV